MYQNAGEKGLKHTDPADRPRRRANRVRGHGMWNNDRIPIVGLVGRASRTLRLKVCPNSDRATLQPFVVAQTRPDATVYTDEWRAYNHLHETGRKHSAVCHMPGQREWARDDDGDGIREVHCNTMEGIWTGLRNFFRPFRGISKYYLSQYLAVFEWAHTLKRVTFDFLRAIMIPCTPKRT